MKKILFVVKSMNIGGVEKSLISLLNTISKDEYDVDVLLLENTGGFLNQIPSWVNVKVLEEYSSIKDAVNLPPLKVIKTKFKSKDIIGACKLANAYLFSKLFKNGKIYYKQVFEKVNKIDKKYDIAVAYSSIINYLSWIVCYKVDADIKIGWIHFDISKLVIDRKLFLDLHSKLEKIYVVSQEALDKFCNDFPELKSKCEVKYNVVDSKNILKMADEDVESLKNDNETIIMTLGRLEKEKGQDIIPQVAEELKEKNMSFKWYLIGDGCLRKSIEEEIKNRGLEDYLILLGTKSNPYPYLKQADIYVQTSVHEGFCITLAEAKVFDNAIISTDFTGAYEQLKSRKNSFVVKRTKNELSKILISCMEENYDKIINNSSCL